MCMFPCLSTNNKKVMYVLVGGLQASNFSESKEKKDRTVSKIQNQPYTMFMCTVY